MGSPAFRLCSSSPCPAALGTETLQVFKNEDNRDWLELQSCLGRQDSSGICELRNVEVLRNKFYGTSRYVVERLVFVVNGKIDSFASYLDNWRDISQALGQRVIDGEVVTTDPTSDIAVERAPFVRNAQPPETSTVDTWPTFFSEPTSFEAVSKGLLAKFKIEENRQTLRDLFGLSD